MAKNKVYALIIQGLVQGVGFRPFVYRIAKDLGMKGCVENMNNGVRILVAATPDDRDLLISRIRTEHPRVAYIHRISYTSTEMDEDDFDDFTITPSQFGIRRGHAGLPGYCRLCGLYARPGYATPPDRISFY